MKNKRFIAGYFLTGLIAISACIYKFNFLNPVTISFQIISYIYWTYLISCLHTDIVKKDPHYPFGPRESMLGALIPFAYIFWNWCWVHESAKWSGLTRNQAFLLGALTAIASTIVYPDNLHKIPGIVNILAFVFLFAQAGFLRSVIERQISFAHKQTIIIESADKVVV